VVIAAAATVILGQETGFSPPGILGWGVVLVGALIPDIDEPRSTASNPAGLFNKLMPRWVRDFLNTPFQAISSSLRSVFGHRGATHYLIWPIIMGGWAWYSETPLVAWFAWGYSLHELADLITRTGIPALGPFYRKNVSILPKPLRLKTGGAVEDLISTACWIYLIYAVYVYF
jgi:inner membrane protein